MKKHKIQWLNIPGYKGETWNPIIGCSKVSDGCKNCYAEKMAMRIQHTDGGRHYHDVLNFEPIHNKKGWTGKTKLVQSAIDKPLHWKKPRVIFVCSMGDLFHEDTDCMTIGKVFEVMEQCPQHIFIVLTKRAKIMEEFMNAEFGNEDPPKNIWMGVTAENQQTANERLPYLFRVPAAVHLISVEPMLGPVDLKPAIFTKFKNWLTNNETQYPLDWVICGGESEHNARPIHPDWARSLRDQCIEAEVPFFFKQWGEWQIGSIDENSKSKIKHTYVLQDGTYSVKAVADLKELSNVWSTHNPCLMSKVGRKAAGNLLDGKKYEQYPALPTDPLKGEPGTPAKNKQNPQRVTETLNPKL